MQQQEQARKKDLGRCFNDEGDVMEEKERKRPRKVPWKFLRNN